MIKEKKVCWLLKINNTKNIRFCQKYTNTNELKLADNKKIIDKLYKENTKEICWIGDEAISYPNFIELVKYSKERNIRNKVLFNNISNCKIEEIKKFIKYIDNITLTLDSIEEKVNEKLGKRKEDYINVCKFLNLFENNIDIDILTMINSQNVMEQEKIENELVKFKIDSWIILGFMPILLDIQAEVERLNVSKTNCKYYYRSFCSALGLLSDRIKHFYKLTEYTISRKYNIILPNGDIAVINDKDSLIIGNILKDTKEKVDKNYNNKKKYLIPKQSEQKIRILIANSDEKIINKVINETTTLKYIEVVGISKTGKETMEKIITSKPDIVFLQYDFEDLLGYNIILETTQKLNLESPVFTILSNTVPDNELYEFVRNDYCKLNALIPNNYYEGCFIDIVKIHKQFRDKD